MNHGAFVAYRHAAANGKSAAQELDYQSLNLKEKEVCQALYDHNFAEPIFMSLRPNYDFSQYIVYQVHLCSN